MHSVIYLYVVCPAFNVLRAIFLNSCVVCPAVNVFSLFVGFAGRYIWFSILFALLLNVCPLFEWALRAVSFTYVRALCPAVNDLHFWWALRAITFFGLLFALLLTSALFSSGLCGQFYLRMFFALLLTICPFCGLCGLKFALVCYSPCF